MPFSFPKNKLTVAWLAIASIVSFSAAFSRQHTHCNAWCGLGRERFCLLPLSAVADSYIDKNNREDNWPVSDPSQSLHFFSKKSLLDPYFSLHNTTTASSPDNLFLKLCRGANITRPSKIQSLAWPVLLRGQHAIVAEQTGSGKTLAYLLPLLQRSLSNPHKSNGAPSLLILAPTAELADQIHAVCQTLSRAVPFTTMIVTSSSSQHSTLIRDQVRRIQRQPMDVLISTPGRLSTILRLRQSGGLDLSHLRAVVLDEVDVLLLDDETFGPQLRTVGAAVPRGTQFVFVTATLPERIVQTIQREFPTVVRLQGPGWHRRTLTLRENIIDVSVPAQHVRDAQYCFDVKSKQLLIALRQHCCCRTLIFCNTVESCRDVENFLNRHDRQKQVYTVLSYHNAMTPSARNQQFAVFCSNDSKLPAATDKILVCTDRAARGVDFRAAPVDHVVLFDFPNTAAEYVRRVGRTARAGRTGYCTILAYGWQLPMARSIWTRSLELDTEDDNDDGANKHSEWSGGGVVKRREKRQKSVPTKQFKEN